MTLTLVLIGIVLTLALAEKFGWGEKLGRVWTWITTEAARRAKEEDNQ